MVFIKLFAIGIIFSGGLIIYGELTEATRSKKTINREGVKNEEKRDYRRED